jgi:hypothetical protein
MSRSILLLCQYDPYNAAMVVEHINAIYSNSTNRIYVLQDFVQRGGVLPEGVNLDDFDAVIIHYSVSVALDSYIAPKTRVALSKFTGLKIAFIQDEYRFVNKTVTAISELGIRLLFTCVPETEIEKVYPAERLPEVTKVNVLTGYNSGYLSLYDPIPLASRTVDIGYRGRVYPAWHGRSGREKWEIAHGVQEHPLVAARGVRLDISCDEASRLYGHAWTDFIRNCRAMLGVESGCSIFDFDGSISAAVETYTRLAEIDLHDDLQYHLVRKLFFDGIEDLIQLNQISPRCLEAIGLRTLLVLFEGEYSGILEPWRHYVPLKKNFSNMEQVLDTVADDDRVAEIVSRAYGEVGQREALSYRTFVRKFDDLVERGCAGNSARPEVTGFYEKFPFYYIANPHSAGTPSLGYGRQNFLRTVWRKMPDHVRQRIINLIR